MNTESACCISCHCVGNGLWIVLAGDLCVFLHDDCPMCCHMFCVSRPIVAKRLCGVNVS